MSKHFQGSLLFNNNQSESVRVYSYQVKTDGTQNETPESTILKMLTDNKRKTNTIVMSSKRTSFWGTMTLMY
jgi:hypothetical protein